MKLWVPAAIALMVVVVYVLFYALSAAESQGAASFGLVNVVGLVGVIVALVGAGLIFRRATPQR